jgi:hypothetical protein
MSLFVWSGLGSSDAGLPLHPQSDQRPRADRDGADLVSAFVSARLAATLPFTRGEHLPAASLVGPPTFRHPPSYPTKPLDGKTARPTDLFVHGRVVALPAFGIGFPSQNVGTRDYEEWHKAYDDPNSGLSWRLRTVQRAIEKALDEHPGPMRVVSSCSGEGRDLLEVLQVRADADRVTPTLIELHPAIAGRAREAATTTRSSIDVRTADAGLADSYQDAVPADLVILVGIFGNISDADIGGLIATTPQFCNHAATVLWTRGRDPEDRNDFVRAAFRAEEFSEIDYLCNDLGHLPAVGVVRYDGEPQALVSGRRLFTFLR